MNDVTATAMNSYAKRKDVDVQLDSEGELPTPNSFCRRSLLVQETFSVHKIRLQFISIGFPIQTHSHTQYLKGSLVHLYRKFNSNGL